MVKPYKEPISEERLKTLFTIVERKIKDTYRQTKWESNYDANRLGMSGQFSKGGQHGWIVGISVFNEDKLCCHIEVTELSYNRKSRLFSDGTCFDLSPSATPKELSKLAENIKKWIVGVLLKVK